MCPRILWSATSSGQLTKIRPILMRHVLNYPLLREQQQRHICTSAEHKHMHCMVQVTFECYGPGGTGFVMECLTDNNTRSSNQVQYLDP